MGKNVEGEPEFITGSELGRRLGVSERAVKKAVDSGRVVPAYVDVKGRRWYIEVMARAQWNRNTLPEKESGKAKVVGDAGSDDSKFNVTKTRALVQASQAELNVIKMKRLKGELVSAEEVARLWERHVGDVKRLFLALPIELRMFIPSLTQENISLIESKIIGILDTLSKWKPAETGNV